MTGYNAEKHNRWLDPPDQPKGYVCDVCGASITEDELVVIKKMFYNLHLCPLCEEQRKKESEE